MKRQKSIGINVILNIIRTIVALFAPLITYPYVARVIGTEYLGSINYTYSIVQYFVLFSGLGISTYGIREGAKKRDNIKEISEFISDCFSINVAFTVLSYIFFCVLLFFFKDEKIYFTLLCMQSFYIIFSTLGIEWVNTIFEDYLYITIRTIVIQILSIGLTFLIVHTKEDYIWYTFVTVTTTAIVSFLNWFHYRKKITIKLRRVKNLKKYLKPIFVFFANKLAVTLYVSADTTMLGMFVGDYSVGIYSVSVKIYTIIKNMLAAVYAVFLPRLSHIVGGDNTKQFKELYSDLVSFMTLIILPATIGLFTLSENIIILLFGKEYITAKVSLAILSIALVFAIYGGLVSAVFDVVMKLEKVALQATILAAAVNIGLDVVLLPYMKEVGAAFTTVLAELTTLIYCFVKSKGIVKYLDGRSIVRNAVHSVVGCVEIFFVVVLTKRSFSSHLLICIFSVLISCLLYFLTLVFVKNKFIVLLWNKAKKVKR